MKNGGGVFLKDSVLVKKITEKKLWEIQRDFINQIMKIQGFWWINLAYNKTIKYQEYLETKSKDKVALKPNYVAIFSVIGLENYSVKYGINRIRRSRSLKLYLTECLKDKKVFEAKN